MSQCTTKATVYQDGADFYVTSAVCDLTGGAEVSTRCLTAGIHVSDFDMAAAKRARVWFLKHFAETHPDVELVWE